MIAIWAAFTLVNSVLVCLLVDQHRACRARAIRLSQQISATQLRIELAGRAN